MSSQHIGYKQRKRQEREGRSDTNADDTCCSNGGVGKLVFHWHQPLNVQQAKLFVAISSFNHKTQTEDIPTHSCIIYLTNQNDSSLMSADTSVSS